MGVPSEPSEPPSLKEVVVGARDGSVAVASSPRNAISAAGSEFMAKIQKKIMPNPKKNQPKKPMTPPNRSCTATASETSRGGSVNRRLR